MTTLCEPLGHDHCVSEPLAHDHSVCDSLAHDHSVCEPLAHDHCVCEPLVHYHCACEPLALDHCACEPLAHDHSVCEPLVHDHSRSVSEPTHGYTCKKSTPVLGKRCQSTLPPGAVKAPALSSNQQPSGPAVVIYATLSSSPFLSLLIGQEKWTLVKYLESFVVK